MLGILQGNSYVPPGFPTSAVQKPGWSRLRGACQQRERHSKFLSYLTGARYVQPWWSGRCQSCNQVPATHLQRVWQEIRRDHPSYCTAEVGNLGGTYELPCIYIYEDKAVNMAILKHALRNPGFKPMLARVGCSLQWGNGTDVCRSISIFPSHCNSTNIPCSTICLSHTLYNLKLTASLNNTLKNTEKKHISFFPPLKLSPAKNLYSTATFYFDGC